MFTILASVGPAFLMFLGKLAKEHGLLVAIIVGVLGFIAYLLVKDNKSE